MKIDSLKISIVLDRALDDRAAFAADLVALPHPNSPRARVGHSIQSRRLHLELYDYAAADAVALLLWVEQAIL